MLFSINSSKNIHNTFRCEIYLSIYTHKKVNGILKKFQIMLSTVVETQSLLLEIFVIKLFRDN